MAAKKTPSFEDRLRRLQEVVAALEAAGYQNLEILDDGEWTAIAANRP